MRHVRWSDLKKDKPGMKYPIMGALTRDESKSEFRGGLANEKYICNFIIGRIVSGRKIAKFCFQPISQCIRTIEL